MYIFFSNKCSFMFILTSVIVQVDLEHNQYRSFQGLTCLMQISTRTEDFVVDTLKLRIHIGPYLREVFKDPTKRKVGLLLTNQCFFFGGKGIRSTKLCDTGKYLYSIRLCMEQIEILCGFSGTLAFTFAICLTLARFALRNH